MVSGEGIWMGVGNALRLAGMAGVGCLYWSCDSCNHRHAAGQGREYETVSNYHYHIITPILACLLVERGKAGLAVGR